MDVTCDREILQSLDVSSMCKYRLWWYRFSVYHNISCEFPKTKKNGCQHEIHTYSRYDWMNNVPVCDDKSAGDEICRIVISIQDNTRQDQIEDWLHQYSFHHQAVNQVIKCPKEIV